jgi:cytochrome c biogenesis protein CcmG, thiol:disulfide interchange protein DsbE
VNGRLLYSMDLAKIFRKPYMKKILLIVLTLFVLGCNQKETVKTYYLSETGTRPFDSLAREKSRLEAKTFFSKDAKTVIDSIYLSVENLDTIVKQDSIIIIYREVYHIGKPTEQSLNVQEEWNAFVKSILNKKFLDKDFKTLDDNTINQKSLNNKPTLVNLWFTSCAPCIEEMPYLNELKTKYGKQVNFISLTYNNEIEVRKFLKRWDFNFTHIINEKHFLKEKNVNQYPLNIFLDKEGTVRFVEGNVSMTKNEDGSISADLASFENNIKKLL